MTWLLGLTGVAMIAVGMILPPQPWFLMWGPGSVLVVAAWNRHTDPRRRAERRARARRGYIDGAR